MGDFGSDLAKINDEISAKLDAIPRKLSLDIFSRIILRSPVDTGRFRGNWQVQIGSAPAGTLELEDASGTATIAKAQAATIGLKAGDVVFLANNLPYAQRLEDGWSTQSAPGGMVALGVQQFHSQAQKIMREVFK